MTWEILERLVSDHGISTVLLLAMGYGVWRVIAWLRPLVERLLNAQIDFIAKLDATIESQGRLIQSLDQKVEKLVELLEGKS